MPTFRRINDQPFDSDSDSSHRPKKKKPRSSKVMQFPKGTPPAVVDSELKKRTSELISLKQNPGSDTDKQKDASERSTSGNTLSKHDS